MITVNPNTLISFSETSQRIQLTIHLCLPFCDYLEVSLVFFFFFFLMSVIHFLFFFIYLFWLCHEACGILVPHQGSNLPPLQWKCGVLTIGPSGKSLLVFLIKLTSVIVLLSCLFFFNRSNTVIQHVNF